MSARINVHGLTLFREVVPGDLWSVDDCDQIRTPKPVYLFIKPTVRQVEFSAYAYHSGGTPDEVHNRVRRILCERVPSMAAANEVLENADVQRLCAIVCDEHDEEWDGRNMVGTLTARGEAAFGELEELVARLLADGTHVVEYDVGDYLADCVPEYTLALAQGEDRDDLDRQIREEIDAANLTEHEIVLVGTNRFFDHCERLIFRGDIFARIRNAAGELVGVGWNVDLTDTDRGELGPLNNDQIVDRIFERLLATEFPADAIECRNASLVVTVKRRVNYDLDVEVDSDEREIPTWKVEVSR